MDGLYVQKLRSWAYETKFVCDVNSESIAEAARRFSIDMDPMQGLLWLLDLSDATDFSRSVFEGIENQAPPLAAIGLARIAVIVPNTAIVPAEVAFAWLAMHEDEMEAQKYRLAQTGVSIYMFASRKMP